MRQKPSNLLANLRNWHFLLRMVVANFIIVSALMVALIYYVTGYDPAASRNSTPDAPAASAS